jgi:hypothetical protein
MYTALHEFDASLSSVLLNSSYSNKHHDNNRSGDKQSNRQPLPSAILPPHDEARCQQGEREAPDNNAKCDLSD